MHAYNYWPVQIFCSEMLFLCVLKYNISPKCINYTVLLLVNMMLPCQQFPNLCEKVCCFFSLKRSSIPFHISWEIVDRATSYSPITKRCNLCILEKYYILRHKERASLNKRSELASNCRHALKFTLQKLN